MYEIFIRADLSEPEEVLAVLIKALVHTLLPPDAGHGKLFKTAATRIGLEGPMRQAEPGPLLKDKLKAVARWAGSPAPRASRYRAAADDDAGHGRDPDRWAEETGNSLPQGGMRR